jgi:DNA-binding response OmpR family regulator
MVIQHSAEIDRRTTTWVATLGPPGAPLAVADGFELDVAGHQLRHGGLPVHLRPREYTLLATLAANPGRAFTRRELVDLAWGTDRAIGLRAVDVHVHWLRSKIEPEPRRPAHLVTVRGFGYRLDPGPLTNP